MLVEIGKFQKPLSFSSSGQRQAPFSLWKVESAMHQNAELLHPMERMKNQ
jgi:hypothetical protein